MKELRLLAGLLLAGLLLAACGNGTSGIAIVGSTDSTIGIGPQRLILAWVDEDQTPQGGPDIPVAITVTRAGSGYTEVPGEWVWSIEGVRGYYVAYIDFDQPGNYEVALVPEEGDPTPATPITVNETVTVPEIGQLPPASLSKTYPDLPLVELSTDPDPEPRFYEITVAEAVTAGEPALIVFASPAFCQTAVCGPTLDIVKQIAASHPELTIVHVEVFDNLDQAAGGTLDVVGAVTEWGLPSEPWVFVTTASGRIGARFEGAVSPAELNAALAAAGA